MSLEHVGVIGPSKPVASIERLRLGEGPLWHPVWQELLAIDVPTGEIYRFDAPRQADVGGDVAGGRIDHLLP
jgi:sugar lactone lactonase YvrE